MSNCKACSAEITWARTLAGNAMPLDAEPSPDGNVLLHDGTGGADGSPVVTVLGAREALTARDKGYTLYKSHFATCPKAGEFRRKGK